MVKLGLELRLSHPNLVSGCPLKDHEHTDSHLGRSINPSVFHQFPQKVLQGEDLCASEILCNDPGQSNKEVGKQDRMRGKKSRGMMTSVAIPV